LIISLNPQALGSPLVAWVALFTLAGIVVGMLLMMRDGVSEGRRRDIYAIGLWAVFWGLIGARGFHVIDSWDFYSESPFQVLYLWNGGLSLWGAIIVGGGGALRHTRHRGFALARFADSLAITGLAGIGVGRIGDLLAGERPGTGTSWPWAIEYTHPDSESFSPGLQAHPVAAYELLLTVSALIVLRYVTKRWGSALPDGMLLAIGVAMLAVGRFAIGFVRTESTDLGLTQAQWVAVAVLIGTGIYAWRRLSDRECQMPRA
jgi:prolipoprotein diacylglyceryltransferase